MTTTNGSATQPLLVGRGVDTLVLNVSYRDGRHKPCKRDLPQAIKEQLDAWKQAAVIAEEPIPVPYTFQGVNLHMYPNGAGKGQWRWLLRCDSLNLLVSMGRLNCVAQVRFSSEFLWACCSLDDAIVRVEEFLVAFFGECVYLQVSEVHLCADIAGWDVESIDQRREFVSRSRKRGTYEVTDLHIEDFSFGLNRSGFLFSRGGPLSCVIYDKTREIRQQSQKWWFHDLWATSGWDEETQPTVWRVEFRFKREVLHEVSVSEQFCGIEDAYTLTERISFLWAYATGHVDGGEDGLPDGWLRLVVPGTDSNRSRWPTHAVWQAVQRAFALVPDAGPDQGTVIRERKRQANLQRATAAAVGYLSSMAAWLGRDGSRGDETDLVYIIHWLRERTPVYLGARSRAFALEVAKKRVRFEQQRLYEHMVFDHEKQGSEQADV
ncbi:MAG: hypothetical protein ACR2H5_00870 [Ktedonobacteraceae bacterium]